MLHTILCARRASRMESHGVPGGIHISNPSKIRIQVGPTRPIRLLYRTYLGVCITNKMTK